MVGDYLLIDSQGIGTWLVLISVSATVALWPLDWTAICCRSKPGGLLDGYLRLQRMLPVASSF